MPTTESSTSAQQYRFTISAHRLIPLLTWTVAGLVLAHFVLQFTHYRIHPVPEALKRLFDLDEETNLPSWYSWTALLLATGLSFVVAAVQSARRDRDAVYWWVLSWGFLVMSLDEDASIHESLNALANESGHASFSWTYPAAIMVAFLGISGLRFLWRLPARYRWWFIASGVVYVGGAVGMEMVGHWWLRAAAQNTQDTLTYNMLSMIEESMEMFGVVAFIAALLSYSRATFGAAGDHAGPTLAGPVAFEFRFPGRRILNLLAAVTVTLIAAHLVIRFVNYRVHPVHWLVRDMFNLGEENNLPAWFAASLMLLAAALLAVISASRRRAGDPEARGWRALALGLVVLSVSKDAALPDAFESLVHLNWSIPAALVALVTAIPLVRFAARQAPPVRRGMVAAAALYLVGALGVEWLALGYLGLWGGSADSLGYGVLTAAKQGFEMSGMLVLIGTLLALMRRETGQDAIPMALELTG